MFFKKCKYIEKKVVKHIRDNLNDFSYSSDESDDSDEEWIKAININSNL